MVVKWFIFIFSFGKNSILFLNLPFQSISFLSLFWISSILNSCILFLCFFHLFYSSIRCRYVYFNCVLHCSSILLKKKKNPLVVYNDTTVHAVHTCTVAFSLQSRSSVVSVLMIH